MKVPSAALRRLEPLARESARQGVPLYVVGGCVRDWLLGRSTQDIDLAVEGEAAPFARAALRLWGGSMEEFGRFGTVRVKLKDGLRVDFARTRAESYSESAALPRVRPAGIEEDLGRRDFTVNAMALRLGVDGAEPVDPHGGRRDLEARLLRVLHPASFEDDPTRLFRAARYAARFGLEVEAGTRELIGAAVERRRAELLSRERVRAELLRLLEEKDPSPAFALLEDWGLLAAFHPRLRWSKTAASARDAGVRLGLLALSLGEEGPEFVRSLRLERARAGDLLAALKTAAARRSCVQPLPALAREVLARGLDGLPPAALEPLLVGGEDLRALGLAPGKEYARLLGEAAEAQWKGAFKTKAAARRWLKMRLA
ncbi:MAG: hypothetical protein WC969_12615 [Elusimicrobiota bacterium]|jgi:tRNA nucleotidyltransferase (CCA-adding enzyme)